MTARWCLETDDRIGMVRDVVACIARYGGDVEAMEVVSRYVYVRIHCDSVAPSVVMAALQEIEGVRRIEAIESLPYEADEQNLSGRALLPNLEAHQGEPTFGGMVYRSEAMRRLVRLANSIAVRDVPVLITGESGTGKELLARAIHGTSRRKSKRFVPVNCAAIPDSLLDSELFGYVEGAFTGAKRGGRLGLFEVADGGTLLLDEIGEMNPAVQAKLLRVLSEGELRRVGDGMPRQVDVRVIAATNRNLEQMVKEGTFRRDLYFRLNVIPIHIPPLRQRRDDILPLAQAFIATMERRLERHFVLTTGSEDTLLNYTFPGNIRELKNMCERACYLAEGAALSPDLFILPPANGASQSPLSDGIPEFGGGSDSDDGRGRNSDDGHGRNSDDGRGRNSDNLGERDGSLADQVHRFELQLIEEAVTRSGSIRKAAKTLGVSHTTLLNKLKR